MGSRHLRGNLGGHTATHDPVDLDPGGCFWIRFRNLVGRSRSWRWARSFEGDGSAVLDDLDDRPGFGSEDVVPYDFAFCLNAPFDAVACPACPADATGDGAVNVDDLVAVIQAWGPCPGCPEDLDGNDADVDDLVAVIVAWGCGG